MTKTPQQHRVVVNVPSVRQLIAGGTDSSSVAVSEYLYLLAICTCELCRLSAYGCLSTGLDEGLIEIVTPASTIANIQLEYPGISKVQSAFNKLCIYQWLQKHNNTKQLCVYYCIQHRHSQAGM